MKTCLTDRHNLLHKHEVFLERNRMKLIIAFLGRRSDRNTELELVGTFFPGFKRLVADPNEVIMTVIRRGLGSSTGEALKRMMNSLYTGMVGRIRG